jgi:hypothetical protein
VTLVSPARSTLRERSRKMPNKAAMEPKDLLIDCHSFAGGHLDDNNSGCQFWPLTLALIVTSKIDDVVIMVSVPDATDTASVICSVISGVWGHSHRNFCHLLSLSCQGN